MRVLIPVDWSDNSHYAFDWYLKSLHRPGWKLILVHFISAGNDKELQSKEQRLIDLQEKYENRLLEKKVDYHWVSGSDGSPGEFIVRMTIEEEVGMVVMGCRGMGKLKKAVVRSVSDYVIEKSSVPVIVCKRP